MVGQGDDDGDSDATTASDVINVKDYYNVYMQTHFIHLFSFLKRTFLLDLTKSSVFQDWTIGWL